MQENFGEKPPVSKTPEEKEKDRQEWRKHFGVQAEMAEEVEQKKKEFVEKMAKGKEEKQIRDWREHFGPLAELQEEVEKIPGAPKQEKPPEPVKAAGREGEPLMKTELDSEYVLGKERAKLARELGERIRAKSAGEVKAAQTPEKEFSQKQEKQGKQEKPYFSLKGFLKDLDMEWTLKLVESLERFAKREKSKESKEKTKKEPAAKREKSPVPSHSLEGFLGDVAVMRQTLKLVEAVEKAAEKVAEKGKDSPLYKFLEKIRWKQAIKNKEKLEKKIEKAESEKKPSARPEKLPISLKEVLKKLGMGQTLKLWKSAEEFARKRKGMGGEFWVKFLEKIQESKRRLEQHKLEEERKWLASLEKSNEAGIERFHFNLKVLGYSFEKAKNMSDRPLLLLLNEEGEYFKRDDLGNQSGFSSLADASEFLEAELGKTPEERRSQREQENIEREARIKHFDALLQELGYNSSIGEGNFGKLIIVKDGEGKYVYLNDEGEPLGFSSYTNANEFLGKKLKDIEEVKKAEKSKEEPPEQKTETATGKPSENPPEVAGGESEEIKEARKLLEEAERKNIEAFGLFRDALLQNNDYAKASTDTENALNDWSKGGQADVLWEKYLAMINTERGIAERLIKADPGLTKLNEDEIKAHDLMNERKAALEKLLEIKIKK